jgi:hypothetical protein
MPLIFGPYSINVINGPSSMSVLVQNDNNPYLNKNTIILFGETHTLEHYEPCEKKDDDCDELITDFIHKLNIFAIHTRIDFYTEFFLESQYLNPTPVVIENHTNEFIRDKKDILKFIEPSDTTTLVDRERELKRKNRTLRGFLKSNMTAMNILYNGCFYKEYKKNTDICPYNNIIWQYADLRKSKTYKTKNIDYTNFSEHTHGYEMFLKSKRNTLTLDHELIDEYCTMDGSAKVIDVLRIIHLSLTNLNLFVINLMQTPFIKKQRDKINKNIRGLFSVESFIKLFYDTRLQFAFLPNSQPNSQSNSKSKNDEYDKRKHFKLITFIELLITYLDTQSIDVQNDILIKLNSIESFTDEEWNASQWVHVGIGTSVLDMYFILRINKEEADNTNNEKLVLGYFGENHLDNITYYLCIIIQTHRLLKHYKNEDDVFRINITDNIDLNKIMNYGIKIQGEAIKTKKIKRTFLKNKKKTRVKPKTNKKYLKQK